ncbi:MAG: hypothetical protein KatS3mg131_1130 [Candidatus Tectimicrobiota bacterium]|nr:MAG: hypothetical protein KatS3mg131_1130 [Candidatus Tectomicrobia bacterium]
MLCRVPTAPQPLEPYLPLMEAALRRELAQLAGRLRGVKVAHLNATAQGGGVAEILRGLVPLMQGLGLDAAWYCLQAPPAFFQATKALHNALQGAPWPDAAAAWQLYSEVNQQLAAALPAGIDCWVVHDPQQVGDREVNAFQRGSEVVVQKSLRDYLALIAEVVDA